MRVLVACEFSGVVRDAFTARGHDAWSCDLLPSETGGKHYQGDFRHALCAPMSNGGWDLLIAHPPCTHLACSGARWFDRKKASGEQQQAIDFFMSFLGLPIPRICIENPVGIMSKLWKKPTQIIHPYFFGDEFQKTTCLWLVGLPRLLHFKEADLLDQATHVGRGEMVKFSSGKVIPKWYAESRGDGHTRSRTFPGFANAMAEQWGTLKC